MKAFDAFPHNHRIHVAVLISDEAVHRLPMVARALAARERHSIHLAMRGSHRMRALLPYFSNSALYKRCSKGWEEAQSLKMS